MHASETLAATAGEAAVGGRAAVKQVRKVVRQAPLKAQRSKTVPAAVDAANISNKKEGGLTYSSILQLLESGLCTLIFMTTNSIATLKQMKALTRPGRVDKTIEFQNATPEQIKGLFMMFYAHFKPSNWKECSPEVLQRDFERVFNEAMAHDADFLNSCDATNVDSDTVSLGVPLDGDVQQRRQLLRQLRLGHLGKIKAKVEEISFSGACADGAERKHWLNALGSIAGNHFTGKIHKYSMAQAEKYFQNLFYGDPET